MQRDQLILERRDKNKRYSPVKGWTEAVDLRAGDNLVLVNGEHVIVEKIQHEILESPINVYNFQVEDYHTYYVGKGILVHNTCTRRAAMRKAKRSVHIPMSATPDYVESVKMVGQNGRPISNGRHFWY
ncbi:HINT domain-containing protein [Lachnospiraceae bacterium CLA-AA-H215]|uniref:HINT domain-containing protein n=1 Tax=Hominifimenecus microfluidus TaxID=2885348 RepID=A0AAE3EEF9_9FIRM|nr:polymorphic toxin-type HINT domain-containing protein [Hominifimenecus microfluidus]MCC2232745.1 HINT domain-containing protein [Hominifimenecus microfluidus]